ncbi:MAG: hypothetical protein ACYTKD_04895 [Planctomycetota bacterium]
MAPADTPLRPESVDCHLHAGLERRETLDEVFEYLRADGRETVGLVDHAELYVETPPTWAALGLAEAASRAEQAGIVDLYRKRTRGPAVFYREARAASGALGRGLRVGVGLEVSGEFLGNIDPGWLDGADFLGICTTQPHAGTAWGEHLAELVGRASALCGGRDMGLVLHHPFRWRLLELSRETYDSMPFAGGFTEADARVAADALRDAGAVAEVNYASFWHLGKDERLLRSAREGFALLRDAGVRFSLGSDFHAVTHMPTQYAPSAALSGFGLTVADVKLPAPFR